MNNYQTLQVDSSKPVLKVALNRPDKGNAVNNLMLEELKDVLTGLRYDTEYRFVIFTGQGKHFTVGADLGEVLSEFVSGNLTPDKARLAQMDGHELMQKLEGLEQITIAAINGPAYGAGLALTLGCDFRVMAQEASLCVPEVARGIFFTWGSTPRLVNTVGAAKAKELIMLCEVVDADQALKMGLVTRVSPASELSNSVNQLVEKLKSGPFLPIRLTKKIVNAASATAFGNIFMYEPELLEQSFLAGAPQENIKMFIESRKKSNPVKE